MKKNLIILASAIILAVTAFYITENYKANSGSRKPPAGKL